VSDFKEHPFRGQDVAPSGAELVELRVKRLPVGADAGITDEAFLEMSFGHILR